jgi:hypothetical protein
MVAPRRSRSGRGAAAVLASVLAIPLMILSAFSVPALADRPPPLAPPVTTTPTTTTPAPTTPAPQAIGIGLRPRQGDPGTTVTVTVTGLRDCLDNPQAMSLDWDRGQADQQNLTAVNARTINDRRLTAADLRYLAAEFTVPQGAVPDSHTVTAACADTSVVDTFTVVAAEKPTLTLRPGEGPPASHVSASGTGFTCGSDGVRLLWDGKTWLADAQSPTFTAQLTVPADASISGHTVKASCRSDPAITDQRLFTVTSGVTTPATEPAALALQPTSGSAGDAVQVTGERFACAKHSTTVDLYWDDGTQLGSAPLDAKGHFDTSFSVPAKADARQHSVSAFCSDGSPPMSVGFTVVPGSPPPPPPPPPDPPSHWWLIALLAAAAVTLAVVYRLHRSRKSPIDPAIRVRAVTRAGGPPVVTMGETPAPGEATHAIRLQAHTDIATVTVQEVNDDHRPE